MPEITDAELRQFVAYQNLGTPSEVSKKISDLEKDNRDQREQLRATKEKLPKDDQVVLPKAEAEALTAYKALGEASEVKTRLEKAQEDAQRLRDVELRDAVKTFVAAAGIAEEAIDTLMAIPQLKDAKFEVRTKKEKNDKGVEVEVQTPYITLAGEGEKAMSFTDAQGKVSALKGLRPATQQKDTNGKPVSFPKLGTNEQGGKGGDIYTSIREDVKARQTPPKVEEKAQAPSIYDRLHMTR